MGEREPNKQRSALANLTNFQNYNLPNQGQQLGIGECPLVVILKAQRGLYLQT